METQSKMRSRKGIFASVIGLICNFVLAAAKITAGLLTGLVSVVADGVNNLSDGGSCFISLISFRIAEKPADKEHPYGHQRAEYVAAMCISFLVLALAVELFRGSVEKIISGEYGEANLLVLIVLAVSVLAKLGMFFFYRIYAKKTDSETLRAAATDSACDCLATLAAGVGALLLRFGIAADGWVGILVALFIFWQGVKILLDSGSKLLGQAPPPELYAKVKERILREEGILGLHDLKIYSYGPNKRFATVHIETDAREPALVTHELLDKIEHAVKTEFEIDLTAHLDPVALDDSEAVELEQRVRAAVEGIVENMNVHDFRVVRGIKTRVVFEVGIPFSCKTKDAELESDICRAVKVLGDYVPVVTIERE